MKDFLLYICIVLIPRSPHLAAKCVSQLIDEPSKRLCSTGNCYKGAKAPFYFRSQISGVFSKSFRFMA